MVDRWICSQTLFSLIKEIKTMTRLKQSAMSLEAVKVLSLFIFFYYASFIFGCQEPYGYSESLHPMINVTGHTYVIFFVNIWCVCIFSACILCVPRACLEMVVATHGCWKQNLDPLKNTVLTAKPPCQHPGCISLKLSRKSLG